MSDNQTKDRATQSHIPTGFRSSKRQNASGEVSPRQRSLQNNPVQILAALLRNRAGLLAMLFLCLGPAAILFAGLTGSSAALAALASASTAVVATLSAGFKSTANSSPTKTMMQRFEHLEDMAWELSESEERYRTLAETFGDLLILRDGNGTITFANQAFEDLQLSPADMKKIDAVNPKAEQSGLAGKEVCFGTNETARWFLWVNLPVRDRHGAGTGVLSIAREVTAFKQIAKDQADAREKAEQASRAKSRFLAMVSHEMRTPLNGILGMSRLLSDTDLSPEQANYNQALSRSAESLLGLINGMLDMTMIEAGRFKLAEKPFDIATLVRDTGELIAQKAYEKDIEFAISVDAAIPQNVVTDPDRVRQILVNLTGNAVKFTRVGGVKLSIENAVGQDGNDALKILVSDTGPGIEAEDVARIFEEFERAEQDKQASVEGAGLGLAIANALAREMGGRLSLKSTGKNGSTFECILPCKTSVGKATRSLTKAEPDPIPYSEPKNAVILSRNPFEAEALYDGLVQLGLAVQLFENQDELLHQLKESDRKHPLRVFLDPDRFTDPDALYEEVLRNLAGKDQLTLCLKPDNRAFLSRMAADDKASWLTRPVRPASLKSLVTGTFAPAVVSFGKNLSSIDEIRTLRSNNEATTARVLLAEDNDINALLVTSALKRASIAVERVENGREAVDRFSDVLEEGDPFDVVLMDMQMPQMNGVEAIEAIRKIDTNNVPCRIVLLTADEQESTRQDALAAGADDIMIKPVDPVTLVRLCALNETEQVLSNG